eukprot:gene11619-biopygen5322
MVSRDGLPVVSRDGLPGWSPGGVPGWSPGMVSRDGLRGAQNQAPNGYGEGASGAFADHEPQPRMPGVGRCLDRGLQRPRGGKPPLARGEQSDPRTAENADCSGFAARLRALGPRPAVSGLAL